MSKTTSDPTKYYRAGFVIRLDKKQIYDKRMETLGLKTAGELITFFVETPGIVEALMPLAEVHKKALNEKKESNPRKTDLLKALKSMPASQLQALLESIKSVQVEQE